MEYINDLKDMNTYCLRAVSSQANKQVLVQMILKPQQIVILKPQITLLTALNKVITYQ
jgi:hypothetical protein